MRLSYSNFSFFVFLVFGLLNNTYAQEQFLKLDSLVIIQSDLPMSLIPSRSWEYEGHDTIQINSQQNQLVKVRYCALTETSTSNNWNANAEYSTQAPIYDLRIGTPGFNFLDGIRFGSESPYALRHNQDEITSRSTTIDRFPDVFIGNGETIFIDFKRSFYSTNRTVDYRLELLYFSYE